MKKYRSLPILRKQIQDMRAQGLPWRVICERLTILTDEGKPNTGLAEDIGFKVVKVHGEEQPYSPADPAVRERLGLAPVCQECKRPLRKHAAHNEKAELPDYMQWWNRQSRTAKQGWIAMLHRHYALKG
jgi:hypothetical protein